MSSDNEPVEYAPSIRAKRFRNAAGPSGSKRRMSAGRRFWYAVLVLLAKGLLRFIWGTCRVRVVSGAEHLEALRREGRPGVIVYWHQMHIFGTWLLLREARAGLPLAVLTSPSITGEVPAAILNDWGIRPVRGSSTRSAAEALREMYTVVATDRQSLALTADGPKGPLHEFKPGAVLLARMSRSPVVPVAWAASRASRWSSWDRFIVPWPFSRVAIVVGAPWVVPPGFQMADLPATAAALGETLQRLEREARAQL